MKYIFLGFIFLSCSCNYEGNTKINTPMAEDSLEVEKFKNEMDKLTTYWYKGVFLKNKGLEPLNKSGVRLSLCQSYEAPSYVYTLDLYRDFVIKTVVVSRGIEDTLFSKKVDTIVGEELLNSIYDYQEKNKVDSSFFDKTILAHYNPYMRDDNANWLLEINRGGDYHFISRKYNDEDFFLVEDLASILDLNVDSLLMER